MMRSNPLATEVLAGLGRQGEARFSYLGLLSLQAIVLFAWWPKNGLVDVLESQHSPDTLTAVVIAVGVTTAYFALRAGAEELILPGQHGLRDWALATPLALGRILRGYVTGQVIHSVYLAALSSPLVLMAFAVSGGEWAALGWCLAATIVQAFFYRMCGAITHLMVGHHADASRFAVRTILFVVYAPVGFLVPSLSHVAFTARWLGERVNAQPGFAAGPPDLAFLGVYAGLGALGAFVTYRLLARERSGAAGPASGAGAGEARGT